MVNIALGILIVCFIVSCTGVLIGLDLKKWISWLFGLGGLLSGFFIGFMLAGVSQGFQLGILFAFAIMFGGAMTRWQRQYFKKRAESWLSRDEEKNELLDDNSHH
jgi:hypothetical protein